MSSDQQLAEPAWVRWLCGDEADRTRFRATLYRFRKSYLFGVAVGGSCTISATGYGWPLLGLVLLASLTMVVGIRAGLRTRIVEVPAAWTFLLLEVNLAASVLLSGGGRSPLLPLLAVPVFTHAVLFRAPVLMAAVGVSATWAVASVALAEHVRTVADAPSWIHAVCYLGLLAALSLAAWWLAAADRSSRGDDVLRGFAEILRRMSPTSDTSYRIGGRSSSSCSPGTMPPPPRRSPRSCAASWRPDPSRACH